MGSPAAALIALCGYVVANGYPDFHQMGYLASGLCCIEELEGLSAQPTAKLGNALGMIGVTTDIASTVDLLSPSSEDGPEGKHCWYWWSPWYHCCQEVQITNLPQFVAAFHSLVVTAACLTCFPTYLHLYPTFATDPAATMIKFLGTFI